MVCNRRTREDVDEETRRECEEEKGGGGGKSGGYGSSTMQSYLKEVVDHLTLRLSDIEFVLDVVVAGCDTATTSSLSSIVSLALGGKSVVLTSEAGGDTIPPQDDGGGAAITLALHQRLEVQDLYARVVHDDDNINHHHPIVEPLSYAASVSRVAGERFSVILNGLEVRGVPRVVPQGGCGDDVRLSRWGRSSPRSRRWKAALQTTMERRGRLR